MWSAAQPLSRRRKDDFLSMTKNLDNSLGGGGPDDAAGALEDDVAGRVLRGDAKYSNGGSNADSADAAAGLSPRQEKQDGAWQSHLSETWVWGDYIKLQSSMVRVNLCRAGIVDHDLASMLMYLDTVLESVCWRTSTRYSLVIDISYNSGITDAGVARHLVPFFRRWPACRSLKLHHTSVGNTTLQVLSEWVAGGHVHELHMSHLGGQLTPQAVLDFLMAVHRAGNYPYTTESGDQAALWLRLERNGLQHTERLVATAESCGMSLRTIHKTDLPYVRPGAPNPMNGREKPEVSLVLFHEQNKMGSQRSAQSHYDSELHFENAFRYSSTSLPMPPAAPPLPFASGRSDSLEVSGEQCRDHGHASGGSGGPSPASSSGIDHAAGLTILEMLKKNSRCSSVPLSEPQPLSTDEFRLQEMERREDLEGGADLRNADTFGADAESSGWSFEENLAANKRIAERERIAANESDAVNAFVAARERAAALRVAMARAAESERGRAVAMQLQRIAAMERLAREAFSVAQSPGLVRNAHVPPGSHFSGRGAYTHLTAGPVDHLRQVPCRNPAHGGFHLGLESAIQPAQGLGPAPEQVPIPARILSSAPLHRGMTYFDSSAGILQ